LRFVTTNTGASTDKWQFDYITLSQGVASQVGIELDPRAVHKDGSTPLTANWNVGLYNITASNFIGTIVDSNVWTKTGGIPDSNISSATTWNAKAATGASAACTYGIANITTSSSGVPTVTCATQQGTVTSITPGNGMSPNTAITTSGSVTLGAGGSVTSTSTNAVSASSHTHAIDSTISTVANDITYYVNRSLWTTIDNYPAACGAGTAVTTIGDTNTCTAFGSSSLTIAEVTSANGNWTLDKTSYNTTTQLHTLFADIGGSNQVTIDAANITAGTFSTGNYVFQDNLSITDNLTTTYITASNSINITGAGQCLWLPGGGSLCGNSSCTWLKSPDGLTMMKASNSGASC
jgi:hypothetical protein